MTDNFFAIFVLFILVILLSLLIYKFYELSKASKKQLLKTSDFNLLLEEIDDIDGFNYFLYEKSVNYEDFEKEKLFLLQYLEKNSGSLEQLANAYDLIEIYIDYKLNNAPDSQQTVLMSFYTTHYELTKECLKKKFEEKSNTLINNKMSDPLLMNGTNSTGQTVKGIQESSLAVQLLKLKTKN